MIGCVVLNPSLTWPNRFCRSISQLAISICVTVYYILIFEYAPTEYQAIRMKISLKIMKISPKCQTWVKVFIKLILNSYL